MLIMAIVLAVYWFALQSNMGKETITYEEFSQALSQNKIESVIVEQHKAVPTGSLEIRFTDNNIENKYLNVSDVNEVQEVLEAAGVEKVKVLPVQEDSAFLNTWLPLIFMTGVIVLMFFMMNRQGGDNAKAMTF